MSIRFSDVKREMQREHSQRVAQRERERDARAQALTRYCVHICDARGHIREHREQANFPTSSELLALRSAGLIARVYDRVTRAYV